MLSAPNIRPRARHAGIGGQQGVSLIELMIAMTITLFILGVMTAVFVSNSRARSEVERTSQELENARYALQQLSDDLQMAGYWAEFNIGNAIATTMATPTTLPNPCTDASSTTNLTALANAMPLAVQGYYQGNSTYNGGSLGCITDWKTGTDVLVVRRVSGCAAGSDANCALIPNAPYFQASECSSSTELNAPNIVSSTISGGSSPGAFLIDTNTSNLTLHNRYCTTLALLHQFLVHIYYVANNDQSGDGIPTLKRAELGAGTGTAAFTQVSIAQGVENMHVEYGVNTAGDHMDTTGTRIPDVFLADPDHPSGGCATSSSSSSGGSGSSSGGSGSSSGGSGSSSGSSSVECPSNFANTVAVQLSLLVRNPTPTIGYTDSKTYTLGSAVPVTINANTLTAGYKRHVYTQEVMLWNPSIR